MRTVAAGAIRPARSEGRGEEYIARCTRAGKID